jgi:hypothetical protein
MSELKFKKAVEPREEGDSEYPDTLVWDEGDAGEGKVYLGEQITGVYVGKKENVGKNKSVVYTIDAETEDGTVPVNVWGSKVLDGKFDKGDDGSAVPEGSTVRITYKGFPEGKNYRDFLLEFAVTEAEEAGAKRPSSKAASKKAPAKEEKAEDQDDDAKDEGDADDVY